MPNINEDQCIICKGEFCRETGKLADANQNHEISGENLCRCWYCVFCLRLMFRLRRAGNMPDFDFNRCRVCFGDIEVLLNSYESDNESYNSDCESDCWSDCTCNCHS